MSSRHFLSQTEQPAESRLNIHVWQSRNTLLRSEGSRPNCVKARGLEQRYFAIDVILSPFYRCDQCHDCQGGNW
jgi:hypothetical protein